MICARLDLNPNIPRSAGGSGTLNFGWGHDKDSFVVAKTATFFTGVPDVAKKGKKMKYFYAGEYMMKRVESLGPEEWKKRSKEVWILISLLNSDKLLTVYICNRLKRATSTQ